MEVKQLKITVVGKSSAGRSDFIRSFGTLPELIDSVGKGRPLAAMAGMYSDRMTAGKLW